MRKTVLLVAAAAALAASPAAAMTVGQVNCPARVAPKAAGPMIVDEMMNYKEGQETNPALTAMIKQVVETCMKREKLPAAQEDLYSRYVIARISHDELTRQLAAMKVPLSVVDRVFDLGPGKRNPSPDQISEDTFTTLVTELGKAGVDVEKLPENGLGMMGAYVTITGEMYRDQAGIN